MKTIMKSAFVLAVISITCLFSCQKKNTASISPVETAGESSSNARTTAGGATTTFTTPNLSGHIIGSSDLAYLGDQNVFSLDGVTYAGQPPYRNSTTEKYYGAAAYAQYKAVVYRDNSAPTTTKLFFDQPGSTLSPYYDLKLGSATGPDFLPDEIEFVSASASSLYALHGNSIYRIDGLTTASVAYAVLVYTFPTSPVSWAFYRKTISHGNTAGTLKVFIAETASPKGSSVSDIKVYTLSGLTGTPTLSSLESTLPISYTNTQNLSSFSTRTNGSTDWYHVVIGTGSTNTSTTYQLTGSTGTLSSPSVITAFPAYVNDCSMYMD